MKCPECGAFRTEVQDTRGRGSGKVVWRKRYCTRCENRWSTWETINNPVRDSRLLRVLIGALKTAINELLQYCEQKFTEEKVNFKYENGKDGED